MKPLEEIGKAFRRAFEDSGLKQEQMAEALGITQPHLSRIMRGKRPPSATLIRKLADKYDADRAQLMRLLTEVKGYAEAEQAISGGPTDERKNISANSLVQQNVQNGYLPVIGRAACGAWMEAINTGAQPEEPRRMEFVGKRTATKRKRAFLVEAAGESMTGAGIEPGDLLLIDPDDTPAAGKPALVLFDGGVTVKLYRELGGDLILSPTNPKYDVLKIDKVEFLERGGLAYRVVGVQKFTEF